MVITENPFRSAYPDTRPFISPPIERLTFGERFATALKKPPIKGLLYETAGWTPEFRAINERVDAVCRKEQVCGHGLDHSMRVAKNAFTLAELVSPSSEKTETLLNDTNLAFLALTHDVGYAGPSISWQNRKAPEHPDASIRWIDKLRREKRSPFAVHHPDIGQSTEVLDSNFDLYSRMIKGMSDDSLRELPMPLGPNKHTPEDALVLTMALADKVDFFRAGRIDGLDVPQSYGANPYFFLSDAVRNYSLDATDGALTYSLDLQRDWTLEHWKEELESQDYGWVLGLGKKFAYSHGMEFEVREMQKAGLP